MVNVLETCEIKTAHESKVTSGSVAETLRGMAVVAERMMNDRFTGVWAGSVNRIGSKFSGIVYGESPVSEQDTTP